MIRADELRQALKREIVGQDRAVDAVVRAVIIAELGISDPTHPLGTFLFLGPTGTGKSQLARSLAKVLHGSERDSIAINCTEFKNPHDVAKLTGAPPGYIGHDQPPFLTPEKLEKRFTVLIFEELEKADRALLDLLLQVLERGELKTGRGLDLDFTRCFIFMTSNIGAKQIDAITRNAQLGFQAPAPRLEELSEETADERIAKACREAVEDYFSPEFINRIDEIVAFNRLRYEHLMQILEKFLLDTRARLAMAGIGTTVDESAKRFLIEKGTNLRYGARPLKRAVREHLEFPIASMLADRSLRGNQFVHVRRGQDRLEFEVQRVEHGALIT